MKKFITFGALVLGLLISPTFANGGTLFVGNPGSGGNLNQTLPGHNSSYYRCTNSVSVSCSTTEIKISYSSQTGGSGTSASPYILTGCSFVSCACSYNYYLSGSTCNECPNNTLALPDPAPHTNTSCQYCRSSWLMMHPAPGVTICVGCPSNGTCNGTTTLTCNKGFYGTTSCTACPNGSTTSGTGATSESSCCHDAINGGVDIFGTFNKAACCYS